ncbi:MAG: hypothetical protein GY822_26470 [Deltaproteobacteria bacterium]|nr:hypothetical protein [Deltaproteobacteria bacterium]
MNPTLGRERHGPLGSTTFFGDVTVTSDLVDRSFRETLRHELVHKALSPLVGSRTGFRATRAGWKHRCIDMGSSEAIRVNGQKVSRMALEHGDEIPLGDSRLVLVLDQEEIQAWQGLQTSKEENDASCLLSGIRLNNGFAG